jgi:hypothetical protein
MIDMDESTRVRLREMGALITDARGGRDMQELADSVGLHRNIWGRAERGENVSSRTRGRIEQALGWVAGSMRRYVQTGEPPRMSDPHMDTYRGRAEDAILSSSLYTDDEKRVLVATLRALRGFDQSRERRKIGE